MTQETTSSAFGIRIGQGFDVHAFDQAAEIGVKHPIMLGGVCIEAHRPLLAHSDGDVLLHALMDGLLGALGLGDIGLHFPDTDPALAGQDSAVLLKKVYDLILEKGFAWVNGDMTIVAQQPKIAPHRIAMQERIAEVLGVPFGSVNVKATTTEHLGFTGRSEGIACFACVLLAKTNG